MTIKRVLSDTRVPVKIWTDDVEPEAIAQLENTARLPFVFKHLAVMPDVHWGMGATVGSVVATKGAICPAAVGVDIGCGMMAVKTALDYRLVQDKIKEIRASIERSVPLGVGEHNMEKAPGLGHEIFSQPNFGLRAKFIGQHELSKGIKQLGSLGGGNHFIEICLDTENNVWVMLHSGSRGLGNKIGNFYINEAKGLMRKMFIDLPDPDLGYFVCNTKEFEDYLADVSWCQSYASENRKLMMKLVLKDISFAISDGSEIERIFEVNCHHNYVETENHYGQNVLVTRKGAVRARKGDFGIIPGSMGARSFIVCGLGNEESFHSCSHGAGRKMSRNKARASFSTNDLIEQTAGVECRKDDGVLDEIPSAYKDIQTVMDNQSDLVSIVAELKQIMCIKG